ncbi:hypothetical protein J6590_021157 [Homalodisca vitripennis]|nr:hypothetical protein J6590_021157 [Homalodisca vitripennis]
MTETIIYNNVVIGGATADNPIEVDVPLNNDKSLAVITDHLLEETKDDQLTDGPSRLAGHEAVLTPHQKKATKFTAESCYYSIRKRLLHCDVSFDLRRRRTRAGHLPPSGSPRARGRSRSPSSTYVPPIVVHSKPGLQSCWTNSSRTKHPVMEL